LRVGACDHDRVGTLATRRDLRTVAVDVDVSLLRVAELSGVTADDEEVLWLEVLRRAEVDVDAVDPVELDHTPGGNRARKEREHAEQHRKPTPHLVGA